MNINRKDFLKAAGLTGAGLVLNPFSTYANPATANTYPFALGVASYTFRRSSLEQTIAYVQRLGIKKLVLKDMHMPLNDSASDIQMIAKKVRDAGIDLYGAGVIYVKSEQEVNNTFEYAKNALNTFKYLGEGIFVASFPKGKIEVTVNESNEIKI